MASTAVAGGVLLGACGPERVDTPRPSVVVARPEGSTTPVPSMAETRPERSSVGRADGFVVPFEYAVPSGFELTVTTESPHVYAFAVGSAATSAAIPGPDGDRGVTVADATGAATESGLGRADVPLGYPSFLEDLRGNQGLEVGPVRQTDLEGHAALQADVGVGSGIAYPHIHLADESSGSVDLSPPDRLIVTEVSDRVILLHIWTRDADEFEAWLPVAMEFVDSIVFVD